MLSKQIAIAQHRIELSAASTDCLKTLPKTGIMIVYIHLLCLCILVANASLCGRKECDSCVLAKEYIPHWSGDSNSSSSYLNCESLLGEEYRTVEVMMHDKKGHFERIDTDALEVEYDKWMESGGSHASVTCQNMTKLLLCMDYFPPCESSINYGVYPCKSTCLKYESICSELASPFICPTDGPDYDAMEIGHGTYPLSNNAINSCFTDDLTILPSRCLATPFDCNFNPYHPECSSCVCENGFSGRECDYCQSNSQCTQSLQMNETCWTKPADVLILLDQSSFNETRSVSCRSKTHGLLSSYIGDHHIHIQRSTEDSIELTVMASLFEMAPELITCQYEQCHTLSSADCSPYVNTLNSCLKCDSVLCSINEHVGDNPFAMLFDYLDTPAVFSCDGSSCIWTHDGVFTQELDCTAGACIPDTVIPINNWPIYVILAAFVLILVMILVIVISTPNSSVAVTPVTREVKKTMSYARMSTHLLTPLMECDEDHSSFLGSHAQFKQTEFAWYDIEVINPEGKTVVNSRIGSVDNVKGLYAIVGPIGTHSRHLLRALCGTCEKGYKVTGTFYRNGVILSQEDLLKESSYVDNTQDICSELTVRETLENAIILSQPPWVSEIETEGRVDDMLADLRLVKYQYTQVKELRKDQMTILRIAIEILTKSSLIVIDNPFDSFTPSMTMNVLGYLRRAQKMGVIILLVFYQPRSMVLQFIQNVILIGNHGNLIYNGHIKNTERYFRQFDIVSHEYRSDSDYLLDIVSRADDNLMERMISVYRNSEDNKLLLLSMRQIRRESQINLQNMSFIKIDNLLSSPSSIQNVQAKNRKPLGSPSGSFSLNSRFDSKTWLPSAETSNSYTSMNSVYNEPSPRASSLSMNRTKRMKSPSPTVLPFNSQLSLQNPSNQQLSARSQESEWKITTKTTMKLLVKRIIRCYKRDSSYIHYHLISAVVVGLAVGLFFIQLKQNTDGINRRYSVILLTVLFSIIQSYSLKQWYDKDQKVFTRDCHCGFTSPLQYFSVVTILDGVFNRFLPSLLYSLITVFLSGLCKNDSGFALSKLILFIITCFLAMSFFSSFFAISHFLPSDHQHAFLVLFIALQVIPAVSNLWNLRGGWRILTLLFPPILFYRLFLRIEFHDLSFVVSLVEGGSPVSRIAGDRILNNKGVLGIGLSLFVILLYSFLCDLVLFLQLRRSVVSSPIQAYECVHPAAQPQPELETSSSDIRIESGDEVEPPDTSLVSTKSMSRREQPELSDSGDDAGLPIL